MVAVSKTDHIIARMVEHAKPVVPGKDIGPVISAEAKERIEKYIDEAEAAGATVLVDGRNAVVPGKEDGYYIGPTIIDHVTPDMRIAQEEVFGPVLVIIRAKDVDEALAVENASPYGNAASVFTESGGMARYVMEHASAGMVGVNVGVPVPREPFSFGGWNDSKFGVGDITGRGSIEFWTQAKKMTTKWNKEAGTNWMSARRRLVATRWLDTIGDVHRDQVRESVPALVGAADGVGEQHPARVRARLGRRGHEDDRPSPGGERVRRARRSSCARRRTTRRCR